MALWHKFVVNISTPTSAWQIPSKPHPRTNKDISISQFIADFDQQHPTWLSHMHNSWQTSSLTYLLHKKTSDPRLNSHPLWVPYSAPFMPTDASQQPFTPGNGSLALTNKAHQLDSLPHIRSVEVLLGGLTSSALIFPDTPGISVI